MEGITVAEIMTREPVTIQPDTNLLECTKKMVKKRVGSLIITDKKMLAGFLTQHDILWAIIKKHQKDLSSIKAKDISPKKVATVKPTASIKDVLNKMKKLKFDRLPVIQKKKVVGVITARDILNFNPEFYPELEEFARIREEENKLKRVKEKTPLKEGICSECGNQGFLQKIDGRMICTSCADAM